MRDSSFVLIFLGFCLLGGSISLIVSYRRHRRDLREYLEPALQKYGVTFISAVYPGMFQTGPFAESEVRFGQPQTKIGGIRGEYNEYRIVSFNDSHGGLFRLWACVEFQGFQFRSVRWRADCKDALPRSLLPLLEN
jgi:hypothetical protein